MNTRLASCGGLVVLIGALAGADAHGQCQRGGGGGGQRGGGSMSGMSMPTQMASQLPYQMNSGMNQYANYANQAYQQMQQSRVQQQLQRAYLQQMLQQEQLARATQAAERREATRQKRLAAANVRRAREAKKQDEAFRSQSSLASAK